MTIDWDDRREAPSDTERLKALAKTAITQTLRLNGIPGEINVGMALTDDAGIHSINLEFRKVDSPTDVLSFPITDYDISAGARIGDVDPATGELLLGDIVVSVERARAQAQEYGHSFEREFCYLIAHGTLHLIGYDHEAPQDQAEMRRMEETVMEAMGLKRVKSSGGYPNGGA